MYALVSALKVYHVSALTCPLTVYKVKCTKLSPLTALVVYNVAAPAYCARLYTVGDLTCALIVSTILLLCTISAPAHALTVHLVMCTNIVQWTCTMRLSVQVHCTLALYTVQCTSTIHVQPAQFLVLLFYAHCALLRARSVYTERSQWTFESADSLHFMYTVPRAHLGALKLYTVRPPCTG